jgi:hypothetical protein
MASEASSDAWEALPTPKMAAAWEKVIPNSAERILEEALRNVSSERRLAWAQVCIQAATLLLIAGSVAAFVLLAKYYADRGAPTQGAAIVCTGLVALVGALLGRHVVSRREDGQSKELVPADAEKSSGDASSA